MPLTIRAALPADAESISRVHIGTWQRAYRGLVGDAFLDSLSERVEGRAMWWRQQLSSGATALVTEEAGRVTGFVGFGGAEPPADSELGEVYAIYVDATYWGRGHGRALMVAALHALRARGFTAAVLWVLATNERARGFYERGGWTVDGGTKTEHIDGEPLEEVRYRRPLED
ncbi:MAG: GNAT family N-acetyltransferase [Chloroflexota bacterium]|nr:GNAT family N-acetyltransferase [Chloroflexota bacterium]